MKRLLALLIFSVVMTLGAALPAFAYPYNAVRGDSGGGKMVVNDGTRYDASLNWAIARWQFFDCAWGDDCRGVHVFKDGPGGFAPTVGVRDYYQVNGVAGYYNPYYRPDGIFVNVWWMDRYPAYGWVRKRVMTHEHGHALGISHIPNQNAVMYKWVCCGISYPQNPDSRRYYWKWIR